MSPKIPTKSFDRYEDGDICIIDIETVPLRMKIDFSRRNANVVQGADLCKHCDGTGNELMSMYRQCPRCVGIGSVSTETEQS